MKTIAVALTGASGLIYGLRLVLALLTADCRVWLLYSRAQPRAAERLLRAHLGVMGGELTVFGREDWYAPLASGSSSPDGMVICPCSMGTLAKVAAGLADDLIGRAADVALKEKRPLIVVPRETPLSILHLENLLRLARAGATILPPAPCFYHRPASIEDLVDFVVARILDDLAIPHTLTARWGRPT